MESKYILDFIVLTCLFLALSFQLQSFKDATCWTQKIGPVIYMIFTYGFAWVYTYATIGIDIEMILK